MLLIKFRKIKIFVASMAKLYVYFDGLYFLICLTVELYLMNYAINISLYYMYYLSNTSKNHEISPTNKSVGCILEMEFIQAIYFRRE